MNDKEWLNRRIEEWYNMQPQPCLADYVASLFEQMIQQSNIPRFQIAPENPIEHAEQERLRILNEINRLDWEINHGDHKRFATQEEYKNWDRRARYALSRYRVEHERVCAFIKTENKRRAAQDRGTKGQRRAARQGRDLVKQAYHLFSILKSAGGNQKVGKWKKQATQFLAEVGESKFEDEETITPIPASVHDPVTEAALEVLERIMPQAETVTSGEG